MKSSKKAQAATKRIDLDSETIADLEAADVDADRVKGGASLLSRRTGNT